MLVGDLEGGGARFAAVVKQLFDQDITQLTQRTLRADVGLGAPGAAAPADSEATAEQLEACRRWLGLLEADAGAADADTSADADASADGIAAVGGGAAAAARHVAATATTAGAGGATASDAVTSAVVGGGLLQRFADALAAASASSLLHLFRHRFLECVAVCKSKLRTGVGRAPAARQLLASACTLRALTCARHVLVCGACVLPVYMWRRLHEWLVSGNWPLIVTTNWDSMIEDAWEVSSKQHVEHGRRLSRTLPVRYRADVRMLFAEVQVRGDAVPGCVGAWVGVGTRFDVRDSPPHLL